MGMLKLIGGGELICKALQRSLNVLLLISAFVFVSCGEKPDIEASLVISAEEISAAAAGGEIQVTITSDQKWNITTIDQLWVDASILAGVPGVQVTVKLSLEPNPTSAARTAVITVVSGATRKTLTIIQNAGFDPSSLDVSKIYIPQELRSMDLYKSSSTWYFGRSKQSEHFIVSGARNMTSWGL